MSPIELSWTAKKTVEISRSWRDRIILKLSNEWNIGISQRIIGVGNISWVGEEYSKPRKLNNNQMEIRGKGIRNCKEIRDEEAEVFLFRRKLWVTCLLQEMLSTFMPLSSRHYFYQKYIRFILHFTYSFTTNQNITSSATLSLSCFNFVCWEVSKGCVFRCASISWFQVVSKSVTEWFTFFQ